MLVRGSFAPGKFVKKMGEDGLQKSSVAADVDMQQVHDAHKRPTLDSSDKGALKKMMAEMAAASRGELPAPGPAAPARPTDEGGVDDARPARPALNTGTGKDKEGESDDDDDDDSADSDEEEESSGALVPCTHEAILQASNKAITGLSLDPAGARLITGGHECSIKMYDFNGMNQNLHHFRELAVWDGQPILDVHYSLSGDKILCATTKSTAVLFSREGTREADFAKGDMYIHDTAQTKGHIAAVCTAKWHPTDKHVCMTAGVDSTVRLWDINTCTKKQVTVIKTKDARGQKTVPSAACYSPKGDLVVACNDGAIKVYDGRAVSKGNTQRAHNEAKNAHTVGTQTSCVCVASNGNALLSRGGDDTLKIWDLRKFSEAVKAYPDLNNFFEGTQCLFSPGDHLFMTGTSVRKNKDGTPASEATLHCFDTKTLEEVRTIGVPSGSIVSLAWHAKLNQLFLGSASGQVHCLYNPSLSNNGIIRAVGKAPKKADITDVGINNVGYIYTPHGLKAFKDDNMETTTKARKRERADPVKSKKPDLGPVAAQKKGLAYPGEMTSRSFTQHAFKNMVGPSGQAYLEQDPREALLSYAEDADKNPTVFGIYKKTQPVTKDTFNNEERMEKRAKPYFY